MASSWITRKFELKDGRELSCSYGVKYIPGRTSGPPEYCYPDESDVGEPEYELDGVPVSVDRLPKGLNTIAEAMYEADQSDKRFSWSEDDSGGDDEPDFDYDFDGQFDYDKY